MTESPYIRELQLLRFKGFKDTRILFHQGANVMTGANNAGKSTVISALRLFAAGITSARRLHAKIPIETDNGHVHGWTIPKAKLRESGFEVANISHNFLSDEAKILLRISSGDTITILWKHLNDPSSTEPPVLYVTRPDGSESMHYKTIMEKYAPEIAAIPPLAPLEPREPVIEDRTLRRGIQGMHSSRYFKNEIRSLHDQDFEDFSKYFAENTPEIGELERGMHNEDGKLICDILFQEGPRLQSRDIKWAGDGIQIWLQLLYHFWKNRKSQILLLDEPDIYLHPDLQRRLSQSILTEFEHQTILTTHSVELLSNFEPHDTIWIDRQAPKSKRLKAGTSLSGAIKKLGSSYQLGVARALRTPVVIFVEGKDSSILTPIAKALGFHNLRLHTRFSILELGGFTRKDRAEIFMETMKALGSNIEVFVILDRDLRSDDDLATQLESFRKAEKGLHHHVWEKRELENYLLDARLFQRVSGMSLHECETTLNEIISSLESDTQSDFMKSRKKMANERTKELDDNTISEEAEKRLKEEFEELWATAESRKAIVDAKVVIREFNRRIDYFNSRKEERRFNNVNATQLANSFKRHEVPNEVHSLLKEIEDAISSAKEREMNSGE